MENHFENQLAHAYAHAPTDGNIKIQAVQYRLETYYKLLGSYMEAMCVRTMGRSIMTNHLWEIPDNYFEICSVCRGTTVIHWISRDITQHRLYNTQYQTRRNLVHNLEQKLVKLYNYHDKN